MVNVLVVGVNGMFMKEGKIATYYLGKLSEDSQELRDLEAINHATSQTVLEGKGSGRLNNLLSDIFGGYEAWDEQTDERITQIDPEEGTNAQPLEHVFPMLSPVDQWKPVQVDRVIVIADVG